jgi:hypothetical protein
MFSFNSARTTAFYVGGNIFCDATDSCLRLENDWTTGLTMDYNCWWQQTGVLMQFLKTPFAATQFAAFQRQTRLDAHSIVAEPRFLDTEGLDFRLSAGSLAQVVTSDGAPAGSRKRLEN